MSDSEPDLEMDEPVDADGNQATAVGEGAQQAEGEGAEVGAPKTVATIDMFGNIERKEEKTEEEKAKEEQERRRKPLRIGFRAVRQDECVREGIRRAGLQLELKSTELTFDGLWKILAIVMKKFPR